MCVLNLKYVGIYGEQKHERVAQKSMKASGTSYGFAIRGHGEVQTIRVE